MEVCRKPIIISAKSSILVGQQSYECASGMKDFVYTNEKLLPSVTQNMKGLRKSTIQNCILLNKKLIFSSACMRVSMKPVKTSLML